MKCFYLIHVFSYPDYYMGKFQAQYLHPLTWEFGVESEADCHIYHLKNVLSPSFSMHAYKTSILPFSDGGIPLIAFLIPSKLKSLTLLLKSCDIIFKDMELLMYF